MARSRAAYRRAEGERGNGGDIERPRLWAADGRRGNVGGPCMNQTRRLTARRAFRRLGSGSSRHGAMTLASGG